MTYNPINEAQRTKGSVQVAERTSSRDEDSSLVAITGVVSVGHAMGKTLGACEEPTCTSEEPTTTTTTSSSTSTTPSSSTSSSTAAIAASMEEMQRVLGQLQLIVGQYKTDAANDQKDLTQHSLDQIQAAQDEWEKSYQAYLKAKQTASWFNPLGAIMNLVNLCKPATISQSSMDTVNSNFNDGIGDIGKYTGLSLINKGMSFIIEQAAIGLTEGLESLTSATGEETSLSDKIESCVSTVIVSAAAAVAAAFICPEAEEGIAEETASEGEEIEMVEVSGGVARAAALAPETSEAAAEAGNSAANATATVTKVLGKIRQLMTLVSKTNLGGYIFCQGLLGSGFPAKFASTVSSDKATQEYVALSLTIGLSIAAAVTGARAFGGVTSSVIDSIGAPRAFYYLQRAQLIIDASVQAQVATVKTAGGVLELNMGEIAYETTLARTELDMDTDSSTATQESSGVVLQNITSEITSITQAVAKSGQAVSQALSA